MLLLAFASALLLAVPASADTIPPLSNSSWAASGVAEIYDPPKAVSRVTPDENNVAGSVLYRSAISPSHLTISFDESMECGEESCNGADGMAFDILDASGLGAPPPVGDAGGALGFYPNKGIAVTLTQNSAPWGCYPSEHFLGIADDKPPTECPLHYLAIANSPPLHNAVNHVVMELDWNTETIKVFINELPALSYTVPPFEPLPPSVYIGFSAGTGNGAEEHRVENVSGTYSPIVGTPAPPKPTPPPPPTPRPSVASVFSPVGGTKLPGGPVTGGTPLRITGSGFIPGRTTLHFELPGQPSARATVLSSTELTAVTPRVPNQDAGNRRIVVETPSGAAYAGYHYFVPQIGVLVFRDPSQSPNDSHYYSACTASVVSSKNRDSILTAGHCVTSGHTWHDEVTFAPGYYGPLCTQHISHVRMVLCGVAPYSLWTARTLVANSTFQSLQGGRGKGLDFGFAAMETDGGTHVQSAVGGGLNLAFCQGTSFPLHPTCDAGSGSQIHTWTAYGEPNPTEGLAHCGPGGTFGTAPSAGGPDMLTFRPCKALTEGASGGPWISGANTVGAVNQGVAPDEISGAYLGDDASAAFNSVQNSHAASLRTVSQNVIATAAGAAVVSVLCAPGSSSCRGTVELAYQVRQQLRARTAFAARKMRHPTMIRLGRTHFHAKAGQRLTLRIHLTMLAKRLIQHHRHGLRASLTIHAIGRHRLIEPVTIRPRAVRAKGRRRR